jgi:hypothetical protein
VHYLGESGGIESEYDFMLFRESSQAVLSTGVLKNSITSSIMSKRTSETQIFIKQQILKMSKTYIILPRATMAEGGELGTLYRNSRKQAIRNLNQTFGIFKGASETLVKPVSDLYIECILSTSSWGGL